MIEDKIRKIIDEAASMQTTGQLCMSVVERLEPGVQIRITNKGVRVTHSRYIDKLKSPAEIDHALAQNSFQL